MVGLQEIWLKMWSVDAPPANPTVDASPFPSHVRKATHIQHTVHFQRCVSSSDVVRDFRGDERHYKASLVRRRQGDGKEVVVVLGEEE